MSSPAEEPKSSRGRRRRLGAFAVDQAVAGSSNVLAAVLAATTLSRTGFGKFGIVFIVFVVGQSLVRALVAEPLLVHPEEADEDPGEALGTAVVIGSGVGAVIALAGVVTIALSDADMGWALIILGASFPLLSLQDVGRYVAFATAKPVAAIHLDLAWLVLMVVGIAGAAVITSLGLQGLVLGWVAAGSAGGLLALWQHRGHSIRVTLAWVRRCWMFSWRYAVSAATKQGGALAGALVLAAIVDVKAVGAVQGALLAMRPFSTIQIAVMTAGTAEIARDRLEGHALRHLARSLSGFTAVAGLVNTAVLLVLPTALGKLFLGDTWPATRHLLIPAGITVVVMGLWSGAWAGLQGGRAVRKIVALDLGVVPVLVGTAAIGAAIDDAMGYYWGVVVGNVVVTSATWFVFLRHTRSDALDAPVFDEAAPEPAEAMLPRP